jgi:putative alpha-1,2-mannosidase
MQVGWLFNYAGKPWLTQKWVREILDRYYGQGPQDAYLGDEDQGQMSAWFVMAALGLFQTDGGCRVDPVYELGSPLYRKVVLHLDRKHFLAKSSPSRQPMRPGAMPTSNLPSSTAGRSNRGGFHRKTCCVAGAWS